MNDMAPTITPKSDQLNADDLLAGPRTIAIRDVKIAPGTEQPVAVYFQGDDGKPYLPCKSMRRVMVAIWGPDAGQYAGRSMTLYRDPEVTWGGMAVGGIRISHMSHMAERTVVVLTATKKARKPFVVMPLIVAKPQEPVSVAPKPKETPEDRGRQLIAAIEASDTVDECEALAERCGKAINYLSGLGLQDLADEIADTFLRRKQALKGEEAAA